MYRNRNLDIVIATIVAVLGALAAAKHLPGQVTIPLGIGLFFAPGYLWSEAILNHRIPGFERAMFSAGMALIFPILGGFLFYGLHIPLKQTAWIGLLVVLTLLGVVATAIQRLRDAPDDEVEGQQPGSSRQQPPRQGGSVALNSFVYGLAAVVAIGAIGYSVKSAETQKFPPRTALSMTPIVDNSQALNIAGLSNNPDAQATAARAGTSLQANATKAHLTVTNYQYAPEQYELKLLQNGKVATTWKFTLADGQTWQKTIAWTNISSAKPVAMLADLYMLPSISTPLHYTTNGVCMPAANLKALPTVLRAEDPCDGKT
jgi:Protein of unknown function (DUF1616)